MMETTPTTTRKGRGLGKKPSKVHINLRIELATYTWLVDKYGDDWRAGIRSIVEAAQNQDNM